ncbi:hypothetical protein [Planomonospora venezuelensis]|uniref:Uncharacterized protein n=1 Tax=Planomonospora venezuelensis TaxID=1999 RepID=A0A841D722_PLAVE|nr:hypothetical protein [Planomonospora venezuelensis]MBB5966031.1 hypothetical protein [Planomonospora venezuelensis]GIN05697.1 hypothetical protein Pve01_73550 [Planomonospora venezuelensis]
MTATPDAEAAEPEAGPPDAVAHGQEEPAQKDARTLGREFSNRAAQPGGTGERLSAERDARSNLAGARVVAGKVVGGDEITYITVSAGGTQLRLFALPAENLQLDAAFVEPPDFGRAEAEARSRRVLILRGSAGSGRFALSRRLLLGLAPEPVRQLHPETDLSLLAVTGLEPGGYLLADLTPQQAARLHAFDVDRLTAELTGDHKLIVTITDEVRFSEPEMERYIVDVRPPAPFEVLQAHLGRILGSADRAALILGDDDVGGLCREQLRNGTPSQAVQLAELVAQAPDPIAVTVRRHLDVNAGADLEAWFAALPDLETQSLAVGIAVLGGEPYELVASASAALTRRLEPPDQPPRLPRPFGATRGARLRALNAHLVPSDTVARHGGTAPGEVVRYQDPARSQQVLLHVWNEYDEMRPELLAWLRLCARSEVPAVRIRAAVAAGLLAARAFDHVRSAIILPWARAAAPELRDVAAAALGVAADSPELGEAVRSLVSAWSADGSTARLQATAVRAWRVKAGPEGCARAVEFLDALGDSQEPVVIEALCESIAEMVELDGSAFASEAIALLGTWMSGRNPDRQVTARLAFLLAAADLVRELPGGAMPALLGIADHDPRQARAIAGLWSAVLNSADMHQVAKDVLAEWARSVDRNLEAANALGRLMAAAATTPRTGRIIALAASGWAHAPRSRAAVLNAVHSERSPR